MCVCKKCLQNIKPFLYFVDRHRPTDLEDECDLCHIVGVDTTLIENSGIKVFKLLETYFKYRGLL